MGDGRLLRRAQPVEAFGTPALAALIEDMRDTMRHLTGAGLAAPQIGVDLRVVIFGGGPSPRYPDASVVCGPVIPAPDDAHSIANPTLVVEILSDSTEACDRGTKNFEYRAFASIKEVVFVSQKKQAVEIHRRNAEGLFVIKDYGPGSIVEFASIGVSLPIAELYRDVEQFKQLGSGT